MASSTQDVQTQQKKLAFSILDFLQDARSAASADVSESLEVAIQCISDSFGVSLTSDEHKKQYSIQPLTLLAAFGLGLARKEQIEAALASANVSPPPAVQPKQEPNQTSDLDKKFTEYCKLLSDKGYFAGAAEGTPEYQTKYDKAKSKFFEKYQQPAAATPTAASSPPTTSPTPASPQISDDNTKKAEEYKNLGNQKLSSHQYQDAVDFYTKAIEFDPNNAIYYANRAAGYSHLAKHQLAIDDCNLAIAKNPNYGKAYSRLGLANFSLGKYTEAVTNYKRALELDPTNVTIKQSLDSAEKKLREGSNPGGGRFPEGLADIVNNPLFQNLAQNLSAGAGAQGGAGAGAGAVTGEGGAAGGAGGMPDVSQLLNNPALLNMAQNVMSQPGFSDMLNNPAMMNMAQSFMQNPEALSGILQGVFGNQSNPGGGGGETPN